MSKKKFYLIIGVLIALAVAASLLVMIFVKDTFGMFTSEYRLNYSDYIQRGEYKGLSYDAVDVKVSKDELKEEIKERVREKAKIKTSKKGKVEEGDTINVSYEGTIKGEPFEGGSAEKVDITIGRTSMIDGFIDGLIGQKVGKTVTLNLKFPKKYEANPDLSGKKVKFKVTIHSKQVEKLPKYNDSFVRKYSDCKTVDEYEDMVKEELLAEKTSEAEAKVKNELWSQILKDSKVSVYPEKQLAYEEEHFRARYEKMAKSYGMKWGKFRKKYLNISEKEFKKECRKYAKSVVKSKLVMHSIAKEEELSVSSKEYKAYLSELLDNAGFTEEQFRSQYNESIEKYGEENDFKSNLLLDKVLDKVMEYGEAKG